MQAGRICSRRNGSSSDFKSASVVAFKVEYRKDGKFRTCGFISIRLFKAAGIEFLELKHRFRGLLAHNILPCSLPLSKGKSSGIALALTLAGSTIVLAEKI